MNKKKTTNEIRGVLFTIQEKIDRDYAAKLARAMVERKHICKATMYNLLKEIEKAASGSSTTSSSPKYHVPKTLNSYYLK